MKPLVRWAKFNLVGVLGMAVQLTTLAGFNHWCPAHYLLATALAIEVTLIHNFLWHLRSTWRDRRGSMSPSHAFLRFQLSNGLVSLVGNLLLMRTLVGGAHLPLLLANLLAIVFCSLANFLLGDRWVFAPTLVQP